MRCKAAVLFAIGLTGCQTEATLSGVPGTEPRYRDAVANLQRKMGVSHDDTIHRPPEQGCPAGYDLVPKMFERHGETWDGCVRHDHKQEPGQFSGSVDFLLGGESMGVSIPVPMPPKEPAEPQRKERV